MVHDYAKKASGTRFRKGPLITSVIVILFAIFFPLTMFFTRYYQAKHYTPPGKAPKATAPKKIPKPRSAKSSATHQLHTQFDFYTLLPKMEVQVNHPGSTLPPQQAGHDSYVLQLATLSTLKDARRMRNQLNELGFAAFIQPTQQSSKVQYRIMTGPYLKLSQAQREQKRLREDQLESLLLRIKSS